MSSSYFSISHIMLVVEDTEPIEAREAYSYIAVSKLFRGYFYSVRTSFQRWGIQRACGHTSHSVIYIYSGAKSHILRVILRAMARACGAWRAWSLSHFS